MIDPIHAFYQHRGRLIPILLVGDLGEKWEAYIDGSLKRVSKSLVLTTPPASSGSD